MPSKHERERWALLLALVVAATGSLWGWTFAKEGQVPWWTYFVVCGVSAFLLGYWILGLWVQQEEQKLPSVAPPSVAELEELRAAAAYRKEFLANVSHELKTSVFVTQGFLDALQEEEKGLSKLQRQLLQRAQANLLQLGQLVEDVLTTSLMESGAIRMQPTRFDMCDLCERVLEDLYKSSKAKQIQLKLEAKVDENWIYADKKYLQQVIRNLIQNAIHYNRPKGEVLVQLQRIDTQLKVSIKDTGMGIPLAEQRRIFERFYRVEKSRSKTQGGTGIGLALVKHVLEAHKSTIKLQSQTGVGSVFSFLLPRAKT